MFQVQDEHRHRRQGRGVSGGAVGTRTSTGGRRWGVSGSPPSPVPSDGVDSSVGGYVPVSSSIDQI